ncbi:hypothetical protein F2Q69_00008803 [Brassica cretica]|uniref:Uncharacterized protein n=1 Tax=Brassica cretica TaxID=69181 RepID=A0A8S9PEJ4_BRACR|nr:hypothetical protein F2Q69_00008803 [Brassica cretica]
MRIEENGIFPRSDKLDPGTEKERANRPKEEYIRDSKSNPEPLKRLKFITTGSVQSRSRLDFSKSSPINQLAPHSPNGELDCLHPTRHQASWNSSSNPTDSELDHNRPTRTMAIWINPTNGKLDCLHLTHHRASWDSSANSPDSELDHHNPSHHLSRLVSLLGLN